MRVYPQEMWCIFDAAFLAADQRTRVISAPTVASCSFPAERQIMVAHSYEVEKRYQGQKQREDRRLAGRMLEFSCISRLQTSVLFKFYTDSQKEADVFVSN